MSAVPPLEVGETGLCWVVYEHGWTALVTVTRRTKNDFTVTGVNAPIVSFGPRVPYWRPDQIVEPTEPVEVDARILALKKQVADLTAHVNRLTKLLGQARAESTAPVVYKLSEASKLSAVLSPKRLDEIEEACVSWAKNGCTYEDVEDTIADLLRAHKGLAS